MNRWQVTLIFAAGMVAGIPAGTLLVGRQDNAVIARKGEEVSSSRRERNRPAGGTGAHADQTKKWSAFVEKLKETENVEDLVGEVAPGDEKAMLLALCAQAGPTGLKDYRQHSAFRSLLKVWAARNFDAAWAWAGNEVNDATSWFATDILLAELVKSDPDRALDLYAQQAVEHPQKICSMPDALLTAAINKGAEGAISFLERLPPNGGVAGGDLEFPQGFDFTAFIAATNELCQRKGSFPPLFPTNTFQSWGARDPDAAYEMILRLGENPAIPMGGWIEVIEGVEKTRGTYEATSWVVDKIQSTANPAERAMLIG